MNFFRPPGTEVKSADLAQSALERAQKVFAEIGNKRLVALAQHGVAPARVTFRRLSVPSGQKGLLPPRKGNFQSICANLTSVHGALAGKAWERPQGIHAEGIGKNTPNLRRRRPTTESVSGLPARNMEKKGKM